jgi:hypothetical protein
MSAETVRKAIVDAVIEVQEYVRKHGAQAALRRDWHGVAQTQAPVSVLVDERPAYRETFEIAACRAAALLASFN